MVWLTGLSGSGKTTLAHALEKRIVENDGLAFVLDGDNIRHGLCSDLGFSDDDRHENIRRVGEVAKLFAESGVIVITAFISPFRADRERVRSLMPHGDFIEVYVRCPLEVCEARDVKGYYQRARSGDIAGYTGISSPYEEPDRPELVIDTHESNLEESLALALFFLGDRQIFSPSNTVSPPGV